jgi:hypothetical protein
MPAQACLIGRLLVNHSLIGPLPVWTSSTGSRARAHARRAPGRARGMAGELAQQAIVEAEQDHRQGRP